MGAEVAKLLGSEPVVLASAGAFAFEATGEETARLLDHPRIKSLVKTVRANRTLSAPRSRHARG